MPQKSQQQFIEKDYGCKEICIWYISKSQWSGLKQESLLQTSRKSGKKNNQQTKKPTTQLKSLQGHNSVHKTKHKFSLFQNWIQQSSCIMKQLEKRWLEIPEMENLAFLKEFKLLFSQLLHYQLRFGWRQFRGKQRRAPHTPCPLAAEELALLCPAQAELRHARWHSPPAAPTVERRFN